MPSDLERLLERAQRGDAEAWAALVATLEHIVYSVPRRYDLGEDDAADVFIETFGALHRNLDRVENGLLLPKWVFRTAARESLRIRRLRARTVDTPLHEILAAEDSDAERAAFQADDTFRLHQAIERLDEGCRKLLLALYFDSASYTEVAKRLDLPPGTIGPKRGRCLEKLRRDMESEGFFD